MGICKFCGQNAGLFKNVHGECQQRHDYGVRQVHDLVTTYMQTGNSAGLTDALRKTEQVYRLQSSEVQDVAFQAWHSAFEHCLSDGVLTPAEESRLGQGVQLLRIAPQTLQMHRVPHRVAMARALRNIMQGNLPSQLPPQHERRPSRTRTKPDA